MEAVSDQLILWIVVGARFLVPLFIPRYPWPAIITALLVDLVDQTVLAQFTQLPQEAYQSYDKALDIYYLTIAYLATFRNWGHLAAIRYGRFLFYFRLLGVVLFEVIEARSLLLLFPNVFEYFFIYYESARLRWNPRRLSKKHLTIAIAAIWILIKLPQEYWLHIAQLDTTEFLRETVFRAPAGAGWGEILGDNLWLVPVVLVLAAALYFVARALARRLPPAEHPLTFAVDAPVESDALSMESRHEHEEPGRFFSSALMEKIVLVAFLGTSLSQFSPELEASAPQFSIGIAVLVVLNSLLSHWLALQGRPWSSTAVTFVVLSAANLALVLAYNYWLPLTDGSLNLVTTLFFSLLLTLIVALFDRYYAVFHGRFPAEA
jgi:hypothetical protein